VTVIGLARTTDETITLLIESYRKTHDTLVTLRPETEEDFETEDT
jgi:hypothetical protein